MVIIVIYQTKHHKIFFGEPSSQFLLARAGLSRGDIRSRRPLDLRQIDVDHCVPRQVRNKSKRWQCSSNSRFAAGWTGAASMPGKAAAILRNSALMLNPALELVSMNRMPSLPALSSPSSTDTCRFSERSVLFPTSIMITSFCRSLRTSSIHLEVFKNDARSAQTTFKCNKSCFHHKSYLRCRKQQLQQRNLLCMRGSTSETSLAQQYPTTASEQFYLPNTWSWIKSQYLLLPIQETYDTSFTNARKILDVRMEQKVYLIIFVKTVIHEPCNNGSFSNTLITQKNQLIFCQRWDIRSRSWTRSTSRWSSNFVCRHEMKLKMLWMNEVDTK